MALKESTLSVRGRRSHVPLCGFEPTFQPYRRTYILFTTQFSSLYDLSFVVLLEYSSIFPRSALGYTCEKACSRTIQTQGYGNGESNVFGDAPYGACDGTSMTPPSASHTGAETCRDPTAHEGAARISKALEESGSKSLCCQ
jgi:hypothetical protein